MPYEIGQGDNGSILELIIHDDNQVIDLTDAVVQVVLTYKSTGTIKQAQIIDAVNGICQIVLTEEDTMFDGVRSFQAIVTFSNGSKFTSNVQRFNVARKIGYIPSTGGSGNVNIVSSNNGHILVNGLDIKVYDETLVKTDIANLKEKNTNTDNNINNISSSLSEINIEMNDLNNKKHNHSNLSVLNSLSTDGINLLFNGSAITSDTTAISNRINSIENSDVIKRLGIGSNGKLTIDGTEVTLDDPTSPIDGGTFTTTFNTTIVDGGEF